jgi:hypothetical protein
VPTEVIDKLDDMATDKSDFINLEDDVDKNDIHIEDKIEDDLPDESPIPNKADLKDDNCFDLNTKTTSKYNPVGKLDQVENQVEENEDQARDAEETKEQVENECKKYNLRLRPNKTRDYQDELQVQVENECKKYNL